MKLLKKLKITNAVKVAAAGVGGLMAAGFVRQQARDKIPGQYTDIIAGVAAAIGIPLLLQKAKIRNKDIVAGVAVGAGVSAIGAILKMPQVQSAVGEKVNQLLNPLSGDSMEIPVQSVEELQALTRAVTNRAYAMRGSNNNPLAGNYVMRGSNSDPLRGPREVDALSLGVN